MYNRYIPQPDGSYRRNRVESPCVKPPKPQSEVPKPPCCPEEPSCPPHEKPRSSPPPHCDSGTGFLQKLLPKDFDTGDLIVILLLLLMAGDCEEDRSTALLTLALYLIL